MAELVTVEKINSQEDRKAVIHEQLIQTSGVGEDLLQELTELVSPEVSPAKYVKFLLRIIRENIELKRQNHQLQQQINSLQEQLKQKDEKLKEQDRLLVKLVNPNTPPSLQHTPFGPHTVRSPAIVDQTQSSISSDKKPRKPGRPVGTKGVTGPLRIPDSVVHLQLDHCSYCSGSLTDADIQTVKIRVIEDIPEPQPSKVVEYRTSV